MNSAPSDPRDLRNAFGAFATGVTVTTMIDDEGIPRGFTANSFSSVSLDPPLVLVCIAKSASSFDLFKSSQAFAVNVLSEEQQWISNQFATPHVEKFKDIDWQKSGKNSPILRDVAAWFDCQTHEVIDAGDHVILLGRVTSYDHDARSPLGYCRGGYVSFGAISQVISSAEVPDSHFSAIIEHDDGILLTRSHGELALPTATSLGSIHEADSLLGKLAIAGIDADLSFVFAVHDDESSGSHNVFYRGQARSVDADAQNAFIDIDKIPFSEISDPLVRTMLDRYVSQRQLDAFGPYADAYL